MDALEQLRGLFHGAPDKNTWPQIVAILDQCAAQQPEHLREVVVPYCYQHLIRWPSSRKTDVPERWFRAWVQGDQHMIDLLELCELYEGKDPRAGKPTPKNCTYYRVDFSYDERDDNNADTHLVHYQHLTSDWGELRRLVNELASNNFVHGYSSGLSSFLEREVPAWDRWSSPDCLLVFINGRPLRRVDLIPDMTLRGAAGSLRLRLRRPLCAAQPLPRRATESPQYRFWSRFSGENLVDILDVNGEALAEAIPTWEIKQHPLLQPFQRRSPFEVAVGADTAPLLEEIPRLRGLRPLPTSQQKVVKAHRVMP